MGYRKSVSDKVKILIEFSHEMRYWTAETLGCMTVMKGAFPMADVYDPPFLNSLGLQTDANTLTGYLVSKLSQDILFL